MLKQALTTLIGSSGGARGLFVLSSLSLLARLLLYSTLYDEHKVAFKELKTIINNRFDKASNSEREY